MINFADSRAAMRLAAMDRFVIVTDSAGGKLQQENVSLGGEYISHSWKNSCISALAWHQLRVDSDCRVCSLSFTIRETVLTVRILSLLDSGQTYASQRKFVCAQTIFRLIVK